MQDAFSSGLPMVTMPLSELMSLGLLSCASARSSSTVGTPIRKEMWYFPTYSNVFSALNLPMITMHPPAYSVGQGPAQWSPPLWNHGVVFIVMSL